MTQSENWLSAIWSISLCNIIHMQHILSWTHSLSHWYTQSIDLSPCVIINAIIISLSMRKSCSSHTNISITHKAQLINFLTNIINQFVCVVTSEGSHSWRVFGIDSFCVLFVWMISLKFSHKSRGCVCFRMIKIKQRDGNLLKFKFFIDFF